MIDPFPELGETGPDLPWLMRVRPSGVRYAEVLCCFQCLLIEGAQVCAVKTFDCAQPGEVPHLFSQAVPPSVGMRGNDDAPRPGDDIQDLIYRRVRIQESVGIDAEDQAMSPSEENSTPLNIAIASLYFSFSASTGSDAP